MVDPCAPAARALIVGTLPLIFAILPACSLVVSTDDLASGVAGRDLQGGAAPPRDGGGPGATALPRDASAAHDGAPVGSALDGGAGGKPSDAAAGDGSITAPDAADSAPPTVCSTGRARVFVTQTMYSPNFGGASGADQRCQSSADARALGGTWRAWLSDSSTSAAQRVYRAPGAYVLLDGTVVAPSFAGLVSGSLAHAIDRSEANALVNDGNTEVWTGFDVLGASAGFCGGTAGDWTSNSANASTPLVGHLDATDPTWSAAYLQACDRTNVRLYCFEACP